LEDIINWHVGGRFFMAHSVVTYQTKKQSETAYKTNLFRIDKAWIDGGTFQQTFNKQKKFSQISFIVQQAALKHVHSWNGFSIYNNNIYISATVY